MPRSRRPIHTAPPSWSQGLTRTAADYQSTVLRLVRQLKAGTGHADTVHAIRIHCRKLQALLELSGDETRAAGMAKSVRRLSKLRALQVFRQYLIKIDAAESDMAVVEAWIVERKQKLSRTQAYSKIEQVVRKQALPAIASPPIPSPPTLMSCVMRMSAVSIGSSRRPRTIRVANVFMLCGLR